MKTSIQKQLLEWPCEYIHESDLPVLWKRSLYARQALIKRLIQAGELISAKKGLYVFAKHYKKKTPNLYEMAQLLHGPSYISFESALSYHQWIPEGVYTTTSACLHRHHEYQNTFGFFSFKTVPIKSFYDGVERIQTGSDVFLMASPWKAIADLIYTRKQTKLSLEQLCLDLRIEKETMLESDHSLLKYLSQFYKNQSVRNCLKRIYQEINNGS